MKTSMRGLIFISSLLLLLWSCGPATEKKKELKQDSSKIELFSYSNNGTDTKAQIYLPTGYNVKKNLPAIFLIDFSEQHFKLATDEFEKVIAGVERIPDFKALVVSLEGIPDIDAEPDTYQEHYELFKNLASYVDEKYTNNQKRTLIGKGSESGIVLMAMFMEDLETSVFDNFIATDPSGLYASEVLDLIKNGNFPQQKNDKKLHFSFSTSNDRDKCNALIKMLEGANYPWLQFTAKEYTDSNYENTYPVSFAEGLNYVFQDNIE